MAVLPADTFSFCYALRSVVLPTGLNEIGSGAFYQCISLCSLSLPQSLHTIGTEAFKDCSSVSYITIPTSVYSIGKDAFLLGDPLAPYRSYITVRCAANSAAAQYCAENRIPCSLTGD